MQFLPGLIQLHPIWGPLLITYFVNLLVDDNSNSSIQCGLILAFIFFLSKTLESLSQRQRYFGAQRIGIQVRAALMTLIYSKSLMIKCAGPTHGKIINLVNVDVERIGDFCWYIHGVWLIPVQVSLGLVILYINLGFLPSISALAVTILVMVCNTPLANMQEKLHSKIMEAKDTRIKMTSEIMKNIRILKLHSWESTFLQKLLQLRDTEKSWLQKYLYTHSAVATLFWTSPTLVSVVTFGICILVNTELTAATVLSALATFRILQEPIYNLPEVISMIAQTKVSLDRIQELINEEDQNQFMNKHTSKDSSIVIKIKPSEYAWETNIYFLDDPFSAVDAHTGTHLFKKCLMQLLFEKTVVYATHQLEFLEAADLILVMKDGKIVESGRGSLFPVILLCQILFQVMQMGSNYWISWAAEQTGRVTKGMLMGTFVLLSGGSSIFILGRTVLMAVVAIETAQRLFHGMITSVFRAPVSFFDTTPSSRILSRSSTDQSTIDTNIPYRLAGLVFALIQLLSMIMLMSQVAWQLILVFLVVFAISIWLITLLLPGN
ncbi:hypothetical protein S83_035619 [Arachis hypogaea]